MIGAGRGNENGANSFQRHQSKLTCLNTRCTSRPLNWPLNWTLGAKEERKLIDNFRQTGTD